MQCNLPLTCTQSVACPATWIILVLLFHVTHTKVSREKRKTNYKDMKSLMSMYKGWKTAKSKKISAKDVPFLLAKGEVVVGQESILQRFIVPHHMWIFSFNPLNPNFFTSKRSRLILFDGHKGISSLCKCCLVLLASLVILLLVPLKKIGVDTLIIYGMAINQQDGTLQPCGRTDINGNRVLSCFTSNLNFLDWRRNCSELFQNVSAHCVRISYYLSVLSQ